MTCSIDVQINGTGHIKMYVTSWICQHYAGLAEQGNGLLSIQNIAVFTGSLKHKALDLSGV